MSVSLSDLDCSLQMTRSADVESPVTAVQLKSGHFVCAYAPGLERMIVDIAVANMPADRRNRPVSMLGTLVTMEFQTVS